MPSITRLLQRVVNIVWVTFALVVVTAALMVGVARMLLPLLDDWMTGRLSPRADG